MTLNIIIVPNLQMRKPRLREIKQIRQVTYLEFKLRSVSQCFNYYAISYRVIFSKNLSTDQDFQTFNLFKSNKHLYKSISNSTSRN